jgi:hypothetical protein
VSEAKEPSIDLAKIQGPAHSTDFVPDPNVHPNHPPGK